MQDTNTLGPRAVFMLNHATGNEITLEQATEHWHKLSQKQQSRCLMDFAVTQLTGKVPLTASQSAAIEVVNRLKKFLPS